MIGSRWRYGYFLANRAWLTGSLLVTSWKPHLLLQHQFVPNVVTEATRADAQVRLQYPWAVFTSGQQEECRYGGRASGEWKRR